jgi:mono/diheme cytochrome c family protein
MTRRTTRALLVSSLAAVGACQTAGPSTTPEGSGEPRATHGTTLGNTPPSELGDAKRPPPPISGGTLLVTKDGLAVAADSDRDGVWLVDLATKAVRAVALQPGDEPGRVVEDGAGRVHVALRGSGAVATIDLASGNVTSRTSVCPAPRGVAYDPKTDVVHVACAGGELVTLPAAGGAPLRTLRFPERDLRDVVVQGDHLFLTRFRSAEVLRLDKQGSVVSRQVPHTPSGFVSPTAKGAPPATAPSITASPEVAWRAIPNGSGGLFVVHQVATNEVVELGAPPGGPVNPPAPALLGNGGSGAGGGGGVPLPPPPPTKGDTGGGGSGDGQGAYSNAGNSGDDPFFGPGCDGTIVKSAVTSFGADGLPAPGASPTIIGATLPVDLAMDEGGNVAIVSAGSDAVFFSPELVSQGPSGCAGSVAEMSLSAQPTAIAYSQQRFIVQTRQPASIVVLEHEFFSTGATTIELPGVSKADPGHAVFHHQASPSSFIACASCHPEGHEDGHLWQFEFGPRRTPTVSGHVLETAPFHWDGSIGDLSTLMFDVFVHRMGGARSAAEPENVAAFASWLDSIPPFPASPTGTEAQIAHGKQLFERADVGCIGCHSGEHFTNNRNEDVGTGRQFQVPPLLGVSARAPFLHDGCAATLADRFDPSKAACNGGESHGHTAQLAPSDIADLIAYLETL